MNTVNSSKRFAGSVVHRIYRANNHLKQIGANWARNENRPGSALPLRYSTIGNDNSTAVPLRVHSSVHYLYIQVTSNTLWAIIGDSSIKMEFCLALQQPAVSSAVFIRSKERMYFLVLSNSNDTNKAKGNHGKMKWTRLTVIHSYGAWSVSPLRRRSLRCRTEMDFLKVERHEVNWIESFHNKMLRGWRTVSKSQYPSLITDPRPLSSSS